MEKDLLIYNAIVDIIFIFLMLVILLIHFSPVIPGARMANIILFSDFLSMVERQLVKL